MESRGRLKAYLAKKNISLEHISHREYKLERDDLVKEIISRNDISLRKIAELTGINRETVRKINMSREPSL